jgi:YidC/Oxa1 family membrane protein insertase
MSSIWNGIQDILGGILSFFYGLIPNFGIAIILLTVTVGLLLFRLTLKQTRSMRAMQAIQPEIKRIQRELKNDKQAQQAAMMELYKEKGVNPAAGCLPLIMQMPIWFALFSVLRSFGSAELAQRLKWVTEGSELYDRIASGGSLDFLWMDLTRSPSAVLSGTMPDGSTAASSGFVPFIPYAILILFVVFTAYWQSKQTMARNTQNNNQPQPGQAVMKIFPFFFGFISFSMPTGLVVYFAASQSFRIGQQSLIIRLDERAEEEAGLQAKLEKKNKNTPTSPEAESSDDATDSSKPVKRRPQGSKKKRGKKRRRY